MLNDPTRFFRKIVRHALPGAAALVGLTVSAPMSAQAPPAAQAPALTPAEAAVRVLDRAQIDALLTHPEKVTVLDIRRTEELSDIGGFPAFLNIQTADLERSLGYIPRDRQIITVSNHAHRAIRAAALLTAKGFRVAGAAGVQDYEAQGGTLSGKKAPGALAPAPARTRAGAN